MKILITCPPMLRQMELLREEFDARGWIPTTPDVVQTLSVDELCRIVPEHDGWIIGDDPANAVVVRAGTAGRLKAAIKWGVGTDNVDFEAFAAASIPVAHTPAMFGNEVADIALGYVIALARHTFQIHQGVLAGDWPKPTGTSLYRKIVGLVGYGDIGRQLSRRLLACGMRVIVYDPVMTIEQVESPENQTLESWPDSLGQCDFLCFTCALTPTNRHMLNDRTLQRTKSGVRIVNVARGPLIDEAALIRHLEIGQVGAVALDVFEEEPVPGSSGLRAFSQNVFGSHNASNTLEAVIRTSKTAISLLDERLT